MNKYTCQCMRCDGTGKYDRGACFGCNGTGYKNQKTKPRSLTLFELTVVYENGSVNKPKIWATSKLRAIEIVQRMLKINGWKGTIK